LSASRTLAIHRLEVRDFRNLEAQVVELGARFNVLSGENGQGKTNLLEALYVATTTKSFRTSTLGDCVRHDAQSALARIRVLDDRQPGVARIQSVELDGQGAGRRKVQLDGKRPSTLAEYALATPIVLFEPASLSLSQGGASDRRRLLDRVAIHLAARHGGGAALLVDLERYRRAHVHRKKALERAPDPRVLDPYERLMAEHGVRIVRARREAAEALARRTVEGFEAIATSPLTLAIAYAPKAPEDVDAFAALLAERRELDARRGSATRGPHLDDLSFLLGGRPARQVASQGQHRALVLALKGAELAAIAEAREVEPILLLDDVSSELDPRRNAALFAFLHAQVGQVVLTTTRPELIEIAGERRDFEVVAGVVRPR
jgi:DNA replication and repair protein RecF